MRDKPEVRDILGYKEQLGDYFSAARANMSEAETFYDLRFDVAHPEGFDSHIPPTARAIIDHACDNLITDNPVVVVPPRKETKQAEEQADKLKEFEQACLFQWELQADSPPLRECAKNLMLYGLACLKGPLYNAHLWPKEPKGKSQEELEEYEAQKRGIFPIVVNAVDPQTVLFDPSGKQPRFVIESYKRLAIDIKEGWPEWEMKGKPFDEVDWVEYWDEDWRCYLADGRPVLGPIKNIYGFVPYAIAYSGFGRAGPSGKPEEKAVGLLHPVFSSLKAEARAKTANDALLQVAAFSTYFTRGDPTKLNLDMSPGGISQIPEGADLQVIPRLEVNPQIYNFLGMVIDDINKATYSDVLAGVRPTGVGSGYQQGLMVGRARMKFGAPLRALELISALTLGKTMKLVENVIREAVSIYGGAGTGKQKTIKPEDISGHYISYVSLEPEDKEEDERLITLGSNLYSRGQISWNTLARKYLRLDNPSEERTQILVDMALRDPTVQSAMGLAAVEKLGMREQIEALMEAQRESGGLGRSRVSTTRAEMPEVRRRARLGSIAGTEGLESPPERGIGGRVMGEELP